MARITVEDCISKFPSRFELVLVASQRARKLHSGDEPSVEKNNDKNTVIALREIADSTISVDDMKENLIQEYQTITISDEEDENIELDSSAKEEENIELDSSAKEEENASNISQEVDNEMKDLIKSEDSEIEEQYEIRDNPSDVSTSDSEDIQVESDLSE